MFAVALLRIRSKGGAIFLPLSGDLLVPVVNAGISYRLEGNCSIVLRYWYHMNSVCRLSISFHRVRGLASSPSINSSMGGKFLTLFHGTLADLDVPNEYSYTVEYTDKCSEASESQLETTNVKDIHFIELPEGDSMEFTCVGIMKRIVIHLTSIAVVRH